MFVLFLTYREYFMASFLYCSPISLSLFQVRGRKSDNYCDSLKSDNSKGSNQEKKHKTETKIKQRRQRAITLQEAIEKNLKINNMIAS